MKTHHQIILLAVATCQLFAVQCSCAQDKIQGRTVAAWVSEVEIVGVRDVKNPAVDVLNSAGARVMPQLALLLRDTSPDQQAKAAFAMSGICYRHPNAPEVHAAIPALTASAKSTNSEVRIYSIQALGAAGKTANSAAPDLIQLTRDTNDSVRMCAVEALGRIRAVSPESEAALAAAMSDTSRDVRITAKKALELLQSAHK